MSTALTFGEVFTKACRATATGPGLVVASGSGVDGMLANCNPGNDSLAFTDAGLAFKDTQGNDVRYSWEELDFILPGDLSLASDKLYTFNDMKTPAVRLARMAGYGLAALAALWFLYSVGAILYGIFVAPVLWMQASFGVVGMVMGVIGELFLLSLISPILLPLAFGAMATGGIVTAFANWCGRALSPLIEIGLKIGYADDIKNGLHVIHADWVAMPWGMPTTKALDLIFIGVKLKRRGLG